MGPSRCGEGGGGEKASWASMRGGGGGHGNCTHTSCSFVRLCAPLRSAVRSIGCSASCLSRGLCAVCSSCVCKCARAVSSNQGHASILPVRAFNKHERANERFWSKSSTLNFGAACPAKHATIFVRRSQSMRTRPPSKGAYRRAAPRAQATSNKFPDVSAYISSKWSPLVGSEAIRCRCCLRPNIATRVSPSARSSVSVCDRPRWLGSARESCRCHRSARVLS